MAKKQRVITKKELFLSAWYGKEYPYLDDLIKTLHIDREAAMEWIREVSVEPSPPTP